MAGTPSPRTWQKEALSKVTAIWNEDPDKKVLVAAGTGSGKTVFGGFSSQVGFQEFNVDLVMSVSPSVNIKMGWRDMFERMGTKAHAKATNESMRLRLDLGKNPVEDLRAICITYAQLAKDYELFYEICRRKNVLLIADEVHHADDQESFGRALAYIADAAKLKLALSGTPFRSNGGALAMCESKVEVDETGKPVRRVVPDYAFSYGDAIYQNACRPVEFVKVFGKSTTLYKNLNTGNVWQKVIDLANASKSDTLGHILNPEDSFVKRMIEEALCALTDIKYTDKRAGMLVVAKDIDHGKRIAQRVQEICQANPNWSKYSLVEVYSDSPGVHDRIKALQNDRTDIVITVRMLSEGVDVKRLRVGLYASDYRTRMFFTQFVGRFVRWEDRLDDSQHARVIIPAHPDLLLFALEIEQMVEQALLPSEGGGDVGEKANEFLNTVAEASNDGLIWRGQESDERDFAKEFFVRFPALRGVISETQAIAAAKSNPDWAKSDVQDDESPIDENKEWRKKNNALVGRIVQKLRQSGADPKDNMYESTNRKANKAVGIKRVDELTPVDALKKRYAFLLDMLASIKEEDVWGLAA